VQFTPHTFLRQVPNALLERFFSRYGEFTGFDWASTKETCIGPVFEVWQGLPEAERRRISGAFRQVHALANSRGTTVLIEAARDHGLEIAPAMRAMKNAHERAFWCFLQHPEVFENARTLLHIAMLPRHSWEKRNGLPKRHLDVTDGVAQELGHSLSAYYLERQGRGDRCKVEYRRRAGSIDSFFAYPADFPDEMMCYDEDGEFARKPWDPAFEVVFSYDGAAGTLELFAQGGRQVRDEMAELFARVVLNHEEKPQPWKRQVYDLEAFKNRSLSFPTDPADQILCVRVKALRLQVHGSPGGRLTFEADGRNPKGSAYRLLDAALNEQNVPFANTTVLEASLQAVFQTAGRRNRSITFKVTASGHDLGDSPEEETLKGYLKRWNIEHE